MPKFVPTTAPDPVGAFEKALYMGNAIWIGNNNINDSSSDHRAVVEVDVFAPVTIPAGQEFKLAGLLESHAWYVADIPMDPLDPQAAAARNAVPMYSANPVAAKVLGYCLSDGTFRAGSTVPASPCSNITVTYEVVEYDPRCVCKSSDIVGTIGVYQQ